MWLAFVLLLFGQPRETIVEIQVHGNLVTSDDEMRRLTGVEIGSPATESTIDDVADRLRVTKRFERVQVLKRFASISDPSQIVLVVIVDEGRVKIARTDDPEHPYRAVRNRWPRLMYEPILNRDDRYGLQYGVRLAVPNVFGPNSRLIIPFAWGGVKETGIAFDKIDQSGFLSRMQGNVEWTSRVHPVLDQTDDRLEMWLRAEHWFRPQFRVGITAGAQRDVFAGVADLSPRVSGDVVFDTRVDPQSPRNAVFGRVGWTHIAGANEAELDGRGYVGVGGQVVVGLRAQHIAAESSLPVYLKPIFGGAANVRGFSPGTLVGDTLTAASLEVLVPITSPLRFLRSGVTAFTDTGAVTCGPELPACDESWKHGFGGSVWVGAAMFHLDVAVAHGVGSSTRVIVSGNVSF